MALIIDKLAELTGLRDRDTLDASLAGAIRELVRPEWVAVHRLIGDEGDRRWLTRARLGLGEAVATPDFAWMELDELPAAGDRPEWLACLASADTQPWHQLDPVTLFPLMGDGDVLGVVEISSAAPLGAESRRMITTLLRVYRNVQSLLDDSERDTLTGLLNRKSFDEFFIKARSWHSSPPTEPDSERRQPAISRYYLGVIDLDGFKKVNDRFGHLVGDEVLLLVSRVMRGCFRYGDQIYRFGGEEFVVMLRCASTADARAALERLREVVRNYAFPTVGQVTVSIGFTDVRPDDSPTGAVDRADKAVYQAKEQGRDRVCGPV